MAEILKKEELNELAEESYVKGLCLIQNYGLKPQKNGGYYVSGYLQAKGQIPFKVWSSNKTGNAYIKLGSQNENDYKNTICLIEGRIDRYSGFTSLVLDNLEMYDATKEGISDVDFLEETYDSNAIWGTLEKTLSKNCSPQAVELFTELVAPVKSCFLTEFAAVHHHDNCKGGLLAHTTKVVRMASLLKMYPDILKRVSSDVLFIGCALHDIGKVFEYSNGSISHKGRMLSHHTFGVQYILERKEMIEEKMGNAFLISLLSIIEQHHGEYEERPRTIEAYVIHKLDNLESDLTSLNAMVAESKGEQIQYNGFKLI